MVVLRGDIIEHQSHLCVNDEQQLAQNNGLIFYRSHVESEWLASLHKINASS